MQTKNESFRPSQYETPGENTLRKKETSLLAWITLGVVKRGLLAFWAAWLSVVALTNILDAMKAFGVLPPNWAWTSGNFAWIQDTMQPLGVSLGVQAVLFGGVIIWEVLAAALFWWATASYRNRPLSDERAAILACGGQSRLVVRLPGAR